MFSILVDSTRSFTHSNPVEHIQVSEDAFIGTVIHVVQAYDLDGDALAYSFPGQMASRFLRIFVLLYIFLKLLFFKFIEMYSLFIAHD